MPVKSKTCDHNLRQSNTYSCSVKEKSSIRHGTVLAQSIESHQIPQRSEGKRECGEVGSCPNLGKRNENLRNPKEDSPPPLFIILWPINKKSGQNKTSDQSKLRLWEFRPSEKILLGIDVLILIRGWTGLWSRTRIDVCSVIYGCCCQRHNSQRGKKTPVSTNRSMDHVIEMAGREWGLLMGKQVMGEWEWVGGRGGHGGGHNNWMPLKL